MYHTIHANKRVQQRGIPLDIVSIIDLYGEDIPSSNGAVMRRIPKDTMLELQNELSPKLYKKLQKKNKAYMVKQDGRLVTLGYQKYRFKH